MILLIGGSGRLGRVLHDEMESRAILHDAPTSRTLDIRSLRSVQNYFKTNPPTAVINTAAITDVDRCEENPALAWEVNALGVHNLVQACHESDSPLIQISTDYVFGGEEPSRSRAYCDRDMPSPLNVYGVTKLAGENFARMLGGRSCVLRTAWLFGPYGPCFSTTIYEKLRAGSPISVVENQVGSPTYIPYLVDKILSILTLDRFPQGVHHIVNPGPPISWYGLAQRIASLSGHPPSRITPVASWGKALRPANSALERSALQNLPEDPPWDIQLAQHLIALVQRDVVR